MRRVTVMMMTMLVLTVSSALAVTIQDQHRIKDPSGKTVALVVTCNTCAGKKSTPDAKCLPGAAEGFWDGEPCGDCLMKANYGESIGYAYDLDITGSLKEANGQPLAKQFVKLTLPNGWQVTTMTTDKGQFHLLLGATMERAAKVPLTKDVGTVTYKKAAGKENAFQLFMLPEKFKPCAGKAKKK